MGVLNSLFGKGEDEGDNGSENQANRSPTSTEATGLTDGALDTLANVLRTTGEYTLPLPEPEGEDFAVECDAWARHVLTGAQVDDGAPRAGAAAERAWREVRHFYRNRRRNEKDFFSGRMEDFRGVIWDLVGALRMVGNSGVSAGDNIHESLRLLEKAVESDSLDGLRQALGTSVKQIRHALTEQRQQFDRQLETLTSQLEAMREDLLNSRRQMELDALTQTHNRGAFDNALQRYVALSSLAGEPLVLLMLDLDHFKHINDTYGHQAGDLVLTEAANCLVRCFLRKDDFVARYGGEEFAVILPDTGADVAGRLATNVVERLRECSVEFQSQHISVTCSVGYASMSPGEAPESLLERADTALYAAKEAGRDRAVCA